MTFNQSMSIPLEQKLVKTPAGIRLTRMPVKELESLRTKTYPIGSLTLKDKVANNFNNISIELAEIRLEIEPGKAKEVVMDIRGVPVTYDVAKNELVVDGVKAPASLQNGKLSLIIYADRTGLEIFANNGLLFMPVNINLPSGNKSISLTAKGGTAKVSGLNVYELKSAWENN
jgi:sucrose-6-phosphate hydrolase SacC (GH32 family)